MAIGDPFTRSFAGTPAADAVKFLCHEGESEPVHGFPTAPCPGGIRMRLIFPSCSNGELDSADHRSHMAYPSEIESGECPEGFKLRTPTLLYESVWQTQEFDNMWSGNGNPFVLSNGDPTGFGLHGDFLNGWDVDVLQNAVLNCKDGNRAADNLGNIKFCPVLAPTLYSDEQTHMCKLESTTGEKVEGALPALAGCNPIQPGPGPASRNPSCGGNQQVTPMPMTIPSQASGAARKLRRRRNLQEAGA
ncbi:MAG: hypothetical protein LQ351_000938 [Letrouitia transgressa]|nr:MAG: hypothetical protein LQ351_000938 [Letrouitia transgressa]